MPSVTLRNVLTFLGNRMSKNDVNHLWEKRNKINRDSKLEVL